MLGQLRKVEKVTARVFCQLSGGGNPVTIFNSSVGCLSEATQQRLAKSCDWESVMVSRRYAETLGLESDDINVNSNDMKKEIKDKADIGTSQVEVKVIDF